MQNKLNLSAIALALSVAACGVLPDKLDETRGWSAAKLYSEARDELGSGNYEKAIQHFEKLESRYPFGTYAQQAQMEIAYVHYKQGDQAQALAAIERFLKLHPNHPKADYMYYLRGLVSFNDREGFLNFLAKQDLSERDPKATRDAFDAFKQLAERYPDSMYTPDALARMKYLVNSMAQHEVHVARYYFRRGAYLAAINRAETAVREYQGAPATEEALFIMARSYDALGLPDLRDDTMRVANQNFPDGAYLRGRQQVSRSWWKFWQ